MVYLITYDLNKSGQNYDGLYKSIKKLGLWWHHLDSNWLVETTYSAEQIAATLRKAIDENDNLLVIRVYDDYAGQLTKKAWDWINKRNFS